MNTLDSEASVLKMSVQVGDTLVGKANTSKQAVVALEERFREAAKFLDEQTDSIKTTWLVWFEESSKFLTEARMWRMAIEKEIRDGTASLKAATEFLASPESQQALKSLREFVELGERLKVLKESGFLDSLKITVANE